MGSMLPIPAGATSAAGSTISRPPQESLGPRLSISTNTSAQSQTQSQPTTAQGRVMPPAVPSTGAPPVSLNPSPVQAGKSF